MEKRKRKNLKRTRMGRKKTEFKTDYDTDRNGTSIWYGQIKNERIKKGGMAEKKSTAEIFSLYY
jgi:hypothetical protein